MNGTFTIDMHSAFIPDAYLQYLEIHSERYGVTVTSDDAGQRYMTPLVPIPVYGMQPVPVVPAHWDPAIRLKDMQRAGVDMQALSVPTTLFNYWQPVDAGITLSRLINDAIAEVVAEYPSRFAGIATIPLQSPKHAVAELERAVTSLGMRAVEIGSSVNEWELDDTELWPFWEAAEALNVPVFIHGNDVPGVERMERWFLPAVLGIPFASSLALANLIFGGVLEEFPTLRLWFPHGGGAFPYLRGRMNHGYASHAGANEAIPRPPSTYLNQVYFDTILFYEPALHYLIEVVGDDHVVLGTDYPFFIGQLDGAEWIRSQDTLTPATKAKILGENAALLLGIAPDAVKQPSSADARSRG